MQVINQIKEKIKSATIVQTTTNVSSNTIIIFFQASAISNNNTSFCIYLTRFEDQ